MFCSRRFSKTNLISRARKQHRKWPFRVIQCGRRQGDALETGMNTNGKKHHEVQHISENLSRKEQRCFFSTKKFGQKSFTALIVLYQMSATAGIIEAATRSEQRAIRGRHCERFCSASESRTSILEGATVMRKQKNCTSFCPVTSNVTSDA